MVNIEVSVFHRRSIGPLSCGQALRLDSPGGLTERRKEGMSVWALRYTHKFVLSD